MKYLAVLALVTVVIFTVSQLLPRNIVYLPMTISVDDSWQKTEIYLRLTDEEYNKTPQQLLSDSDSEDVELRKLIVLLEEKNVIDLLEFVHPRVSSESDNNLIGFLEGAVSYWNDLQDLQIERKFLYSNEKTYVVSGRVDRTRYKITIRFAFDEQAGQFKYAPYGMETFVHTVISMWARQYADKEEEYKPISALSPGMLIRNFEFEFENKAEDTPIFPRERLVFDGQVFDTPQTYAADLQSVFVSMQDGLRSGNFKDFLLHHTRKSTEYLSRVFPDTSGEDFENFRNTLLAFDPAFVIDASPVYVLYTTNEGGGYGIYYFVKDEQDSYRLANAGVLPFSYQIFNNRKFIDALDDSPPFSSLKPGT